MARRFNFKLGPYEGLFREDPKNTGGIQFVRRRVTARSSQQHHQGCPCPACEETQRMILESQKSSDCGCKCRNCQQPIPPPAKKGESPKQNNQRNSQAEVNAPRANVAKIREPATSTLVQSNTGETIFGPSDDNAILDLAVAGESFCRIARHLGVDANAIRERFDTLVIEQAELFKRKAQQSGNSESKSKKQENQNAKSNKNEGKENKPGKQDPGNSSQKVKNNAGQGNRNNQRPLPSSRARYTIPSLREHLSRPLPDPEPTSPTSHSAPNPPRNRAPSARPPWASDPPRSARHGGPIVGTYDAGASDTAADEHECDYEDGKTEGSYHAQYRPQLRGRGGRRGGAGAEGAAGRGVRFLGAGRMPRADAVFSPRDIAALTHIIEDEEPGLWVAVARRYRREAGVWFNPVDIEMKFTGLVDD